MSSPLLTTTNLRLIPLSRLYAEDIFREFTSEITLHMFPQPPKELQETQKFIQTAEQEVANGTDLHWVILHKATEEFLGCCGLHNIHTPHPEPGIWIKQNAHGHGYGREAVHAVYTYACKHLHHIQYFQYPVAVANIASRKIPESMGGLPMKQVEEPRADGILQQIIYYHIPVL